MTDQEHAAYVAAITEAADRLRMPVPYVPPASEMCGSRDPEEYVRLFAHLPGDVSEIIARVLPCPGSGDNVLLCLRAANRGPDDYKEYRIKRIEWEEYDHHRSPAGTDAVFALHREGSLFALIHSLMIHETKRGTQRTVAGWYRSRTLFGMWLWSLRVKWSRRRERKFAIAKLDAEIEAAKRAEERSAA